MVQVTEKLADFVVQARFSNLPEDVVYETKRVLLDSVGCAVAGLPSNMGRISVDLARRLGGSPESTIIGTHDKVSCANAAFANGELMTTHDFDAGYYHAPAYVVPTSLASAEAKSVSGEALILAIALGHEIATRLMNAVDDQTVPDTNATTEGRDKVGVKCTEARGFSRITIAAAASAGKLMGLNKEQVANAIGIAGYVCPPNVLLKFKNTSPTRMSKCTVPGWGAHAGLISALLAERGFTGDTDLFEGEYTFWQFTGNNTWNNELLLEGLGTNWVDRMSYKLYPLGM